MQIEENKRRHTNNKTHNRKNRTGHSEQPDRRNHNKRRNKNITRPTGILSDKEVKQIHKEIDDSNYFGSFPILFLAEKDNLSITLRYSNSMVYYYKNADFKQCYKKQTKEQYIKERDQLVKNGWKLL